MRKLSLTGSIKQGKIRQLEESLWLMGNTSIGYSQKLAGGEDHPFAVIFDPAEPYPGLNQTTLTAVDRAIENAFEYRREYPRSSSRPHVDEIVENLFRKRNLHP